MDDEPLDHGAPVWLRLEVIWPLAILAGFGGTWTGLAAGSGWLATLGALGLYAPIHVELGRRNASGVAAATGVGWALGIAGAVLGAALEAKAGSVVVGLPLAQLLDRDLDGGSLPSGLLLVSVPLALSALGSSATHGAFALLLAALGQGAVCSALSTRVIAAVGEGVHPLFAVLAAWPPHHAAWVAAALLWAAVGGAEAETGMVRSLRTGAWTLAGSALLARLVLGAS